METCQLLTQRNCTSRKDPVFPLFMGHSSRLLEKDNDFPLIAPGLSPPRVSLSVQNKNEVLKYVFFQRLRIRR